MSASFLENKLKMSLREYIIKAKLKLVEIRLLNSDYTLTEIADDLAFTNVSHLSMTFKRYAGTSLHNFKNNGEYMLLKRRACTA
ncbi:MAG: helix-turn-helix domain-containing protein [Pricia sp.]